MIRVGIEAAATHAVIRFTVGNHTTRLLMQKIRFENAYPYPVHSILVTLLAFGLAACGNDPPGGTETAGTTNDDPPPVAGDGVCEADKGETFPDCAGLYSFQCQNDNLVNFHTDFNGNKKYDDPYQGCLNWNPATATQAAWDAAKSSCSYHCYDISSYKNSSDPSQQGLKWEGDGAGTNYQCAEANWTDVDLWPNHPCAVPTSELNLGPVLAALGPAAATAAAQLPCDLSFDCSSYLDFLANEAMWTAPGRGVRYTADVLTESVTASVSLLNAPAEDLVGQAAYSPTYCGAAACPFYLAQMDLTALTSMRVNYSDGTTSVWKTLSGLTIGLEEPALGMWLPATGDVIFPPNSLGVRVDVSLSGTDVAGENGSHSNFVPLPDYVFGTLDGDRLTIEASGTDFLGSWSIDAIFAPPPPQ
jgi:hypothetical protein